MSPKTPTGTGGWSSIPMNPDDAFKAVANSRRRLVLLSVDRGPDPVSATDLSVEIAAIENRVDPCNVTGKMRTRVYIGLIQTHLDTLDNCRAVAYDSRSKQVQQTESTPPLAEFIRKMQTSCYVPETDKSDISVTEETEPGESV